MDVPQVALQTSYDAPFVVHQGLMVRDIQQLSYLVLIEYYIAAKRHKVNILLAQFTPLNAFFFLFNWG